MVLNCKSKNLSKQEQYLCKIKSASDGKYYNQPSQPSYRQACNVYDRLQKSTFLALLGDKTSCKIQYEGDYKGDLEEVKLKCNSGKKTDCCGETQFSPYFCCNSIYSVTREYFENLTVPWNITSFDSKNRKACIEIKSKFGTRNISIKIPEQNFK